MSTRSKKSGFIMQAGILAAAGLICRIIGILYRSPLTSIIGDEGNGYYSSAYNIYVIILLLSSYSIPSAISKVIAGKLALKEYRNAHKVFKCALVYVLIVGMVASLLTILLSEVLVQKSAAPVLMIFAPTIFLSGIVGVFRGYFQAHGTMMPTSLSQILEQIFNAVVSVLAAYLFVSSVATGSTGTKRAVYGAAGSAIGTGSGVAIALLFMLGIYMVNRKAIKRRVKRDQSAKEQDYGSIFGEIISMVTPIVLSTFIYQSSTSVNQTIYMKILEHLKGISESQVAIMYGIFAGKAVVIANIPIALSAAMSSAVIPSIASSYAIKDKKTVKKKIAQAIRTTMLVSIPAAVGLAVLAKPITMLLFPQKESLNQAALLLASISITVVFYALSTLSNAILQAVGMVIIPVRNAAIALILQIMVLVPILLYTEWNLYALSIAMIAYSSMMCLFNQLAIRRRLNYKQDLLKIYVKPFIASGLMGIVAYLAYEGVYALLSINVVALAVAIGTSGIVYFVSILLIGGVTAEDLSYLPKGYMLAGLGRKFHLIREEKGAAKPKKQVRKKKSTKIAKEKPRRTSESLGRTTREQRGKKKSPRREVEHPAKGVKKTHTQSRKVKRKANDKKNDHRRL